MMWRSPRTNGEVRALSRDHKAAVQTGDKEENITARARELAARRQRGDISRDWRATSTPTGRSVSAGTVSLI